MKAVPRPRGRQRRAAAKAPKAVAKAPKRTAVELSEVAAHLPGVVFQALLRRDGTLALPYVSESPLMAVLGVSVADLLADPARALAMIDPDDLARFQALRPGVVRESQEVEFRVRTTHGELRCLRVNTTARTQSNGDVLWHGVVIDDTDRKATELALRESEARFAHAFEHAAVGILVVGSDGRPIRVNPAFCRMLGYDETDLLVRSVRDLTHPDDLPATDELMRQLFAAEVDRCQIEKRYLHRSGATVWGRLTVSLVRSPEGLPLYVVAQVEDLTERKRAEAALEESESTFRTLTERFALAVAGANDGIWDWNLKQGMVYLSPRFKAIMGYQGEEMVVSSYDGIVESMHPDDRERVGWAVLAHMRGRTPHYEVEYRLRHRDGTYRWVLARGLMTRDASGDPDRMAGSVSDITERKQAEAALRESEDQFRTMAETIPAGTFIFQGTELRYVNHAAEVITGYSRDELLKMHFWDPVHPDFQTLVRERGLARQRGEQPPGSYEIKLLTKAGEERWGAFTAGVISYGGGSAVLGTAFDITERKRSEQALRASEEKNQAMLDATPDVILRLARDSTVLDVKGDTRYWRSGPADVVGHPLTELQPPGVAEGALRAIERALATGAMQVVDFEAEDARGPQHFEARIVPCGGGEVLASMRDVTKRRHIEAALRRRELELREERDFIAAVLDTVGALVIVLDPQGRVVRLNRAAERTTGYTLDEVRGRPFWEFLAVPKDREGIRAFFEDVRLDQVPSSLETYWLARDGSLRLISWQCSALMNGDALGYLIGGGIDITERRQAEEEARQRQTELAHVSRVSTMGEMAAELAHELNQPLSAIVGYAKGCAHRISGPGVATSELLPIMHQISEQAVRAGEIIRRLRDFVRKEPPQRELLDLNDLVREAVGFAEIEARQHDIPVRVELVERVPTVVGDGIQVQQVILNLLRNGIESMLDPDGVEPSLVVSTQYAGGPMVEVAISDCGKGLPKALAQQVYDPFVSTKPNGLGMGLSISRSIIEAHGGRLWSTANSDRGTTFCFTLPVARGG